MLDVVRPRTRGHVVICPGTLMRRQASQAEPGARLLLPGWRDLVINPVLGAPPNAVPKGLHAWRPGAACTVLSVVEVFDVKASGVITYYLVVDCDDPCPRWVTELQLAGFFNAVLPEA